MNKRMSVPILLLVICVFPLWVNGQVEEMEEWQSSQAEVTVAEDDHDWQEQEFLRKSKADINEISAQGLQATGFLTEEQVRQFLLYRKWLGPFIDIHELQAVPGWDTASIRRLLPFLRPDISRLPTASWNEMTTKGNHTLLIRPLFSKSALTERATMEGNNLRLFVRYQYRFKNKLRWGWSGEKDAGESFFRKSNRQGFDFNSFHVVYRPAGRVNGIWLGDFTVNLGQGLLQWQNLSLGKTSNVLQIVRQSEPLKPYSSAGEYSFYRGMAVSGSLKNVKGLVFVSLKPLHAKPGYDSVKAMTVITSIDESGYHRTISEIEGENRSHLYSAGAQILLPGKWFQLELNCVGHRFGYSYHPRHPADSVMIIEGRYWLNGGVSYRYQFRNLLGFGEIAVDRMGRNAMTHSLVISLQSRLSVSVLFRNINRAYGALFSSAFTDNGKAADETGLYVGMEARIHRKITLQAFTDLYRKARINQRVSRPPTGIDQMIVLVCQPDKNTQLSFRCRLKKTEDDDNIELPLQGIRQVSKTSCRLQLANGLGKFVETTVRFDWLGISGEREGGRTGWMSFVECRIRPKAKWWKLEGRYGLFETDDYEARIYAGESDLLYSYNIASFYGRGERFYLLTKISVDFRKGNQPRAPYRVDCWLKAGFTKSWEINTNSAGIPSARPGYRSDWRLQVIVER